MGHPDFSKKSRSLIKKHLTENIYEKLRHLSTLSGFTIDQAIRSGLKNPDSSIGIYAGDEDSYKKFNPVLDPIILDYHKNTNHRVGSDFKPLALPDPDPAGQYIRSTRIRLARNLKGYSFPCNLSLNERQKVEDKIINALDCLPGDLKGAYASFEQAEATHLYQLKKQNLLFKKGDRFQEAAGFNLDFPRHRGVFHSLDKQFLVWINEEDHLRIISMEKSSNFESVFNRLGRAIDALSELLDFAHDSNHGFLTSCPTNIGTTMRAGVHIRLEKLEQKKELLHKLAKQHNLQIRGTGGEKTQVKKAVFDISNRQRLGITESRIIKTLHKGITAMIHAEKSL
ncbi:MAG: phosphagen kinase [Desulfobacula sp.]|nr:phosphagen kinase [Desulfobacula sp.]